MPTRNFRYVSQTFEIQFNPHVRVALEGVLSLNELMAMDIDDLIDYRNRLQRIFNEAYAKVLEKVSGALC